MNSLVISAMLAAQLVAMTLPSAASYSSSSSSSKDIAGTSVMEDLLTDKSFASTYEAEYPKKTALANDAFGNEESAWQAVSLASGIRDWTETYLYFYHPLCDDATWKSSDGLTLSTEVRFRVTMAMTGSLDSYEHHQMSLVSKSDDLRFWKFVINEDISPKMKDANYRAFRISEFEITDKNATSSNAYAVSKTFAWSKQSDGTYKETSQIIDTVSLRPYYSSFVISGKNGSDYALGHGLPITSTPGTDDTVHDWIKPLGGSSDYGTSRIGSWLEYANETTVFSVTFPISKTMGELCGSDLSYRMENSYGLYGSVSSWSNAFDQDSLKKISSTTDAALTRNLKQNKTDYPSYFKSESSSIRLSTGLDSDWVGVETLSTEEQAKKFSTSTFWLQSGDPAGWALGYADKYDLPAIQKLSPLSGSDFVKEGNYDKEATNPYAISSAANDYLKGKKEAGDFVLNDFYTLRFAMKNLHIMVGLNDAYGTSLTSGKVYYGYEKWDAYDVDVLDLHFFKDGSFYTIGVVADSGVIITDPTPGVVRDSTDVSWRWLLITVAAILLFGLVWLLIKTLRAAFGGKEE